MSGERFTLDTNILVYGVDDRDSRKHDLALDILRAAVRRDCPLALQAIGEFLVATTRKLKLPAKDAGERALLLSRSFDTFPHSLNAIRAGIVESGRRFSFWDAVLLASAAEAGCTAILSEDMQDGARLGSIMVCNPFGARGLSQAARDVLG
jgi:predicted nucleic acid-binding protein